MKYTKFPVRILKGFGVLVMSDFVSLMLAMLFINNFNKLWAKLISGIICIIFLAIFMFSHSYNLGQEDRKREKRGFGRDIHMSKKLGAVNSILPLVFLICLILSKIGAIGNFLPIYKLTNAFFFPIVQIFASGSDMTSFPIYGFFVIFVLIFVIPVSIYIGYDLGYKDFDISFKIFYQKKS